MFGTEEPDHAKKRDPRLYIAAGMSMLLVVVIGGYVAFNSGILRNRTVSGEMFIVTSGRENIKLALVEVCIVSEKRVVVWIAEKKVKAKIESPKAEKPIKAAQEQKEIAEKNYKENLARAYKYESYYRYDPSSFHFEIYTREKKDAESSLKVLEQEQSNLAKAESAYYYWFSPQYFLDGLNQCEFITRTNSDGKFVLSLPGGAKYAVAAQADRKLLSDTEFYHWLLWLDPEVETLTLSNNNLMRINPSENVVRLEKIDSQDSHQVP